MSDSVMPEIDQANEPIVLETLKKDWPRSIHVYYFIKTASKWASKSPKHKLTLLCPDGNPQNGTVVCIGSAKNKQRICIYTLNENYGQLETLLLTTKLIAWEQGPTFEAIDERFVPVVKEAFVKKGVQYENEGLYLQLWLPPCKVRDLTVSCPEDVYIADLDRSHCGTITEAWPYKFPEAEEAVMDTLTLNCGLGLFLKEKHLLVAWTTEQHFGALGMLHTDINYRRRGFGQIITKALAQKLASNGSDPYACINKENFASSNMFEKLGFELTSYVIWIEFKNTPSN